MLFYISFFFIPFVIWLVVRFASNRKSAEEIQCRILLEDCALCHEEFEMSELIEKEVGEYGRIYCFCRGCIDNLHYELHSQEKIGAMAKTGDKDY